VDTLAHERERRQQRDDVDLWAARIKAVYRVSRLYGELGAARTEGWLRLDAERVLSIINAGLRVEGLPVLRIPPPPRGRPMQHGSTALPFSDEWGRVVQFYRQRRAPEDAARFGADYDALRQVSSHRTGTEMVKVDRARGVLDIEAACKHCGRSD